VDKTLAVVINTTKSRKRFVDHTHLRRMTLLYNLPYFTTVEGAENFIRSMVIQNQEDGLSCRALQT